jgi:hypothetical protein
MDGKPGSDGFLPHGDAARDVVSEAPADSSGGLDVGDGGAFACGPITCNPSDICVAMVGVCGAPDAHKCVPGCGDAEPACDCGASQGYICECAGGTCKGDQKTMTCGS